MNFFKLYIGDYQRDTAHLSITEHGAYMLMLQHYYATEKPLPAGKALHRMLRAQDKAERDAVDAVAAQFWQTTEAGLVNERADVEITKAEAQATTNARIAREREDKRKPSRKAHEQSTNRATNDQPNQTPDTNLSLSGKEPRKRATPKPDDVDEQVWADWLALRKAKRAPVTPTVVQGAITEAAKAEMTLEAFLRVWCRRGTQGLEASWLKEHERAASLTFRERDAANAAARVHEMTGGLVAAKAPATRRNDVLQEAFDAAPRLVG